MGRTGSRGLPEKERRDERTMSTTAETNIRPTEQELVERWRAEALERAGYPEKVAAELGMRGAVDPHRAVGGAGDPEKVAEKIAMGADVDLPRAVELLEKGCAPELAAKILR